MDRSKRDSYQVPSWPGVRPRGRARALIAMDIMTSPVVAVGPDSTLDEVCDLLVTRDLSAVAVIDQGVLLGIVSEEDLIHRAEIGKATPRRSWWFQLFGNNTALAADYLRSHSIHVTDVMTRKVVTVSLSTRSTKSPHCLTSIAPGASSSSIANASWGSSPGRTWCVRWLPSGRACLARSHSMTMPVSGAL